MRLPQRRRPLRRHYSELVRLRAVKIRQPFPVRRIFVSILGLYIASRVFDGLVLGPLIDFLDEAEPDEAELERMRKAGLLKPEYYPLPFTIRAVPQPPYRGGDPDWLAMCDFQRDPKARDLAVGTSIGLPPTFHSRIPAREEES